MSDAFDFTEMSEDLVAVLESAEALQHHVPDATLVGGSAAARYANHRSSYDHDHVIKDLRERFDLVLEALESDPDWITNRVTPGKIILGQLGDIEAGVRQMIRTVPLEVREVQLPSGNIVRVPTQQEALRIKAYLAVKRNQVRDYLGIAALSHRYGRGNAARALNEIDRYYTDPAMAGTPVADQIVRQMASVRPKDRSTITQLDRYKNIRAPWNNWDHVKTVLLDIASRMERMDYS